MKTGKFLEGDIVSCAFGEWGEGTIYYHKEEDSLYAPYYAVHWEYLAATKTGHNCNGIFSDEGGRWMPNAELELVSRPDYVCAVTNRKLNFREAISLNGKFYSKNYLETLV